MANVEIKVISYEEARLSYFKELQERQKKRFEQFEKSSAIKELPPQERYYQLSKMGEVLQYYDDIVKMLEADVVPKSEVDELQAEKDALIKNYAECMKGYASEIFAEIEFDICQLDFDREETRAIAIEGIIAKAKKKYTEKKK